MNTDEYIQHKVVLQEILNGMDQEGLTKLFDFIVKRVPDIHYTKNKNGCFLDIKQIPPEIMMDILRQVGHYKVDSS